MAVVPTTSKIESGFGLATSRGVPWLQHLVSADLVARVGLLSAFWVLYAWLGFTMASTRAFGRDDVYVHLFDADVYPFIKAVAGTDISLFRTETHPLFLLFFRPAGTLIAWGLGSDLAAAVLLTSLAGAISVAMAHLFLRLAGLPRLSALVWSVVLGLSFTHLVFASIPDTFIFSAASVIALFVFGVGQTAGARYRVMAGIIASGILVTNFVQTAIVFPLGHRPGSSLRRRLLAAVGGFLLVGLGVLALGLVQGRLYPPARHKFLYLANEVNWMFVPRDIESSGRRFKELVPHMFVYSLVSPRLELVGPAKPRHRWEMPTVSMQRRRLRFRPVGTVASGLWQGLMAVSAAGLVRSGAYRRPVIAALALSILFNLGLHYFYGREMFLYSADWTFLIVGLVALGLARGYAPHGWVARVTLAAALGLAVSQALNNGAVLRDLLRAFEGFRQATLGL